MNKTLTLDSLAFSHGQLVSKQWLLKEISPYIKKNQTIWVFGAWYNITGFLLHTAYPNYSLTIRGFDIDPDAVVVANKINEAWVAQDEQHKNFVADVNELNWSDPNLFNSELPDIVITTSAEHFIGKKWFNTIPKETIVAIQTAIMPDDRPHDDFLPSMPESLQAFAESYKFSQVYFADSIKITYPHWGYERLMIIGKK